MSIKRTLPFLGIFLLLQTACVDESKQEEIKFDQNQLTGHWEIVEAYRNGRKTETLDGTFYDFNKDGTMATNLTPKATPEQFKYHFDGKEIKQEGGAGTVFKVDSLSDSYLDMSMIIQKFPFRLVLSKEGSKAGGQPLKGIPQ